ncbi:MAG TPA: hypothetical protein VHZ50_06750 [Puia sp.]|nr:hypothetical protein [Puia sp.]
MQLNNLDKKIPDFKVKIYGETAKEIFRRCFEKAEDLIERHNNKASTGTLIVGNIYKKLSQIINLTYYDARINESFLRNKDIEIKNLADGGDPYQLIGFDNPYIFILAHFAGIDNYHHFDKEFAPTTQRPVLFAPEPFGIFTVVRVPMRGIIKKKNFDWEYCGSDNYKITGEIVGVNPYFMPGDRDPLWVEIKYKTGDKLCSAYFADDTQLPLKPILGSDGLITFLNNFIASA